MNPGTAGFQVSRASRRCLERAIDVRAGLGSRCLRNRARAVRAYSLALGSMADGLTAPGHRQALGKPW